MNTRYLLRQDRDGFSTDSRCSCCSAPLFASHCGSVKPEDFREDGSVSELRSIIFATSAIATCQHGGSAVPFASITAGSLKLQIRHKYSWTT